MVLSVRLPVAAAAAGGAVDALTARWRALLAAALAPLERPPSYLRVNASLGGLSAAGDYVPLYLRAEAWCDEVVWFSVAVDGAAYSAAAAAAVAAAARAGEAPLASLATNAAPRVAACAGAAGAAMRELASGEVLPDASLFAGAASDPPPTLPELLAAAAAEKVAAEGLDAAAAQLAGAAAPAALGLTVELTSVGAPVAGAAQVAAAPVPLATPPTPSGGPRLDLLALLLLLALPLGALLWALRRRRARQAAEALTSAAAAPSTPPQAAGSGLPQLPLNAPPSVRRAHQQSLLRASKAAHEKDGGFSLVNPLSRGGGGGGGGTQHSPNVAGAALTPFPWVQLFSKTRRRAYFVNTVTGQRTWELPNTVDAHTGGDDPSPATAPAAPGDVAAWRSAHSRGLDTAAAVKDVEHARPREKKDPIRPLAAAHPHGADAAAMPSHAEPPAPPNALLRPAKESMPPGWTQHWSAAKRAFYFQGPDGTTTWQKPHPVHNGKPNSGTGENK